jgi:hypothetical protein
LNLHLQQLLPQQIELRNFVQCCLLERRYFWQGCPLKLRNGVLGVGDGDEVIHSNEVVHEGWERSNAGCRIKNKTNSKSALLNCGADGCDGSGSREKNGGFYFNIQYKNRGCITKRSTCRGGRGRRSETRFRKIKGEIFPGFPLRAMSHADFIYGALTEIWFPILQQYISLRCLRKNPRICKKREIMYR